MYDKITESILSLYLLDKIVKKLIITMTMI